MMPTNLHPARSSFSLRQALPFSPHTRPTTSERTDGIHDFFFRQNSYQRLNPTRLPDLGWYRDAFGDQNLMQLLMISFATGRVDRGDLRGASESCAPRV